MKNKKGQIIIVGIIFLAVVLTMASTLFSRVSNFMSFSSASIVNEQATNLAEAGLEKALWQLNQTAGSYTGEADTTLGSSGTFTVTITNKNANLKTLTATGFVPNSTKPRAKRTIKVDAAVDNQQISFHYAVQVGTGGVSMANSSTINGSVYSNGNISGSGPSSIIGDAYAVGTISNPPSVDGTSNPNSPPSDMPTIDYNLWETAANINNDAVTCTPTCIINSNQNIGPKKYIGNLSIENGAIVTMKGPVYATGNFSISNLSQLNLDNSFGSYGTVLIVDGTVTVQNNGHFNPTNANPKGYILVDSNSTSANALVISNNAANALFYALVGGATISNNANVTALVANSLTMRNSSTLNYDSGLAAANFSTGPGGSWQMIKGTYKFSNQ